MEWDDDDDDYREEIEPIDRQVYDVLSPNNKIKYDLIRHGIIERKDGNIDESRFPPDQWQGSSEGNTSIDISDMLDDTEILGGIDSTNIQLRTVYLLGIKDNDDRQSCLCNAYILGAQNDRESSRNKYLYVKFTDNAADPTTGERYYKIAMENIKSIGPASTGAARGRKRSRKTRRKKNKRKRSTKKRKRL